MSAAVAWGLLSALAYGTTDFGARFSGRSVGVWRTMLYGQSAALLVVTAVLLCDPGAWIGAVESAPPRAFAAAIVSVPVLLAATAMLYNGLSSGRLSVVAPVTASYGAVTALIEAAVGGGFPAGMALGLALTAAGAALSAVPPRAVDRPSGPSGLGWALGAAVGYGVGFWIQGAAAVPALGPLPPLWLYYAIGPVALSVAGRLAGRPLDPPRGRALAMVIVTGLLAASGYLALMLGYRTGAIALVTVLSSLASAVTVLLACVFLGERVGLVQLAGVAAVLVGLAELRS